MKKRLKKLTAICLLSFLLISFGIGTDSGVKTSGRIDPGPAHSMISQLIMRFYEINPHREKILNFFEGGLASMNKDVVEEVEKAEEIDLSSMNIIVSAFLLGNSWQTWN